MMLCDRCQSETQATNTSTGDHWVSHNGDSYAMLRRLPDATADAVITDPPYNTGASTAAGKLAPSGVKYCTGRSALPDIMGDGMLHEAWHAMMMGVATECYRIAKPGATVVMFCDWRNYTSMLGILGAAKFKVRCVGIWDKRNSRPLRNGFRLQSEWMLCAQRPGKLERTEDVYLPGVLSHATLNANKVHQTQKPLGLLRDLVRLVPDGGHVLDPFQGSGTTGVAVLQTGRRLTYTGIEGVPEYHAIACQRLREAAKTAN